VLRNKSFNLRRDPTKKCCDWNSGKTLKGVRDENLLASAVLTPQSSFGGKSPYTDLIDVAAAYLFYICRNHPFLDGNKHTAMMSAIVFLRLNGIEPAPDSGRWERLMLDVAASKIDRQETTECLPSW